MAHQMKMPAAKSDDLTQIPGTQAVGGRENRLSGCPLRKPLLHIWVVWLVQKEGMTQLEYKVQGQLVITTAKPNKLKRILL